MKHSQQVLILLMALFVLSQIIGLVLIAKSSDVVTIIDEETDEETTLVVFDDTAVGERPEIEGSQTLLAIAIGIIIGTSALLLLSKFKKIMIWKHWFFLASAITMSISFGVITNNYLLVWILAVGLGAWKVYKSNFIIHNLTELFIYPGIAILLVPLLNLFYAFLLLILISIYDAYAVWKSKHMITMANFAKSSNLFPGLAVSYNKSGKIVRETKKSEKEKTKSETQKVRTGILGGGDVAFPLIFAGTFLVSLLEQGFSYTTSIGYAFIVSAFAGLSLLLLFIYGKKDRYYPAMPFISAGCFVGYLVAIGIMII